MLQVVRHSIFSLVCFLAVGTSLSTACQWPVNSGPVNESVPQYRPNHRAGQTLSLSDQQRQHERSVLQQPAFESLESIQPDTLPNQSKAKLAPPPHNANETTSLTQNGRYPLTPLTMKSALRPNQLMTENTTKTKKKRPASPIISYDIYRDRNPLPIDPRKPCVPCTNPPYIGGHCNTPGLHGRPYQEREPGACQCGHKKCAKCKPMFSVYWPRPFSAKLEESCARKSCKGCQHCQKKQIVDIFDRLIDFKLVDYQRHDNGYCGEDSDPYGCLGENRMIASEVAGVGYRFPSVPIDRSASKDSF